MKKITLLFLFMLLGFNAHAQFPESFEGATFPPTGWTSFVGTNGEGPAFNWSIVTPGAAVLSGLDGVNCAFVRYEVVPTSAEDWLVTPQVAITAANSILTFSDAQQFTVAYNSVYDVRVSTTSQTDIASFTTVSSRTEANLSIASSQGMSVVNVDLSAYVGQSIYIAFVMTNNDGDNWFLDNVAFIGTIPPAPDCVSNPVPVDGAIIPLETDIEISWDVATTGEPATSYNIYFGDDPMALALAGSVPDNTPLNIGQFPAGAYDQTFYWQIVPVNSGGEAVGCPVWSFTSEPLPVCLGNTFMWPTAVVTPAVCDGITPTLVANNSWAGDYFEVDVVAGETYTFTSSVATDYLTLSTDGNVTGAAASVTPLVWVSDVTGTIRVNINLDAATCGTDTVNRITNVVCGTVCLNGLLYPSATFTSTVCDGVTQEEVIDDSWAGEYSNIDVVTSNTYTFGSSVATDYFTISLDGGVTAVAQGVSPLVWQATTTGTIRVYLHTDENCGEENVGRSRWVICDAAVLPDCVSNPTPADGAIIPVQTDINLSWDVATTGEPAISYDIYFGQDPMNLPFALNVPDNTPIFAGQFGATQFDDTFYWQVVPVSADGPAVGCPIWSFTSEPAPPGPANDNLANAEVIACGTTVFGATSLATLDEDDAPDGFGADMDAPNVWYSFTGSGFSETVTLDLCGSGYDTSILVYTGTSGNLTLVAGNDDDNTCVSNALNSKVTFTSDGTTTYLIAVEGFNPTSVGTFEMAVSCVSACTPAVANQDCGTSLAVNVDGTITSSDNTCGTINPAQPTCDPFGSIQDVWFSFVAPASGLTDVSLINGSMTSANYQVYSGACGSLTPVGTCSSNITAPNMQSLTGLTAGTTYYVQVWSNGSEEGTFELTLSDPGLGNNNFDNATFAYYPNPVSNILNLEYSENITKVHVVNILGQQVMTKSMNTTQTSIDMSSLPAGTYLVKVAADDKEKTIKVLKQ